MSKIVKSLYASVNGTRTIHTIPVIKVTMPVNHTGHGVSDPEDPEPVMSPEEIMLAAREEASHILSEAQRVAETLIAEANAKAEALLDNARLQAEHIMEESRQTGYRNGYEEGKAVGEASYNNKIEQALELINRVEMNRKTYQLQAEQELLELACAVARKIMGKEIECESSWVSNTVKSALAELVDRSQVEVIAHPDDIPILVTVKEEMFIKHGSQVELQLKADPAVERGGCLLRTRQGTVDARIDSQLQEVRRALLDMAESMYRG
ncbi:FliH/SctL family protein [Effusibacillus lacus]|uniref:Flagellar assembly protein FliH n=1 Tax=Effusibacillus lacus TaxID=1348429 RepID=A0A292YK11_9BACL|nr:FliH/SctL family protein [Effusibacillus lacus]TCS76033.1 flagellar assembly protein FliH [Effusibacillus lacus]GAX91447.1 flagellar assembly protein FliH [Effusibacillus lacus]